MRKSPAVSIIALLCLVLFTAQFVSAQKKNGGEEAELEEVYATLTWDAPTTNTDGTPLRDLKGYNIYYRRPSEKKYHLLNENMPLPAAAKGLCRRYRLSRKTVCRYDVTELEDGTYWFVVRAVNKAGKESDNSNAVKKSPPETPGNDDHKEKPEPSAPRRSERPRGHTD